MSNDSERKKANPTHWYNGQYLLQRERSTDPANPGFKLTKAAEEAQTAKWEMLIANRKPTENITPELLGGHGRSPPLLLYGWTFNHDYFLEYAKRHRLTLEVPEQARQRLGCATEEFNFADVTEEHCRDEQLLKELRSAARFVSVCHLREASGLAFTIGRPLSLEWDRILYVWTNYDMAERYLGDGLSQKGRFEEAKKVMDEAMNECLPDGKKSELLWWWSFDDNDVNVLTSID
ncbi:hypothetical protein DICSQDRAFT_181805 [Dichomitus squalens LYAD-421 SS1]|uniref:Uncharacterized protein n=2 Tax=Dichomitus squalens TaxID=114155 RepID=A0A4Q9PYU5_9APHY|nr:uncharacterized protein DICSQDRAFT_181805 [Dichomitus squalens LYAD-421 SS1]EJF59642.1 hypothetical protein DICSQDRAFT_181805 [Dichomitus squalens LYAD-421 SS1]TBU23380.1 hypothetical protein BD311DRAFT_868866 [Dichomitus squalens]TBU59746.1 hypothetical protein BD310DRAFT_876382 [Dichomitus squalens]